LYLNGQGLPRDPEQAYAWFSVGASHKHQKSQAAIESARKRLSPEELTEANKLAEKLTAQYGPDPKAAKSEATPPE
jgi:TPR repeat protein